MATEVKPMTRYEPTDWFTSNFQISQNAERGRDASSQTRQEARYLRNETGNKTKWDQHDNNTRLADRIDDIKKWKGILERTLSQLDKEIADLSDAKELTEEALAAKEMPLDTVIENLVSREGRVDIDLVHDDIEKELKNEKDLIEKVKLQLQQKIDEAFEQLCLLQESRQQVMADLHDKNVALGIDVDQYNLSEKSPNISFKPDPCRIPKGTVTPQNWEDFSRYNKDRAEAEMRSSTRLREAIHHTLHQTENDIEAQRQATDYAARRRIHETERALDELEWQKKQTEDEIGRMEDDIRGLEAAIRDKIAPSKLAQTRQENRTERPGVELCRDAAQYGLCAEIHQLDATKRALEEKLRQSRHALDNLYNNLDKINNDIMIKKNTLDIDRRLLETRDRLKPRELENTDKNLLLTGIERERSKVLE